MTDLERSRWSWPRIVGAAVAVSALVSASGLGGAAIVATWGPGAWSWGDVPGWIEALATVAAAIGASVAIFYAHRAYVIERNRDLLNDQSSRRLQAEQVAAWLEKPPVPGGLEHMFQANVSNASGLPVYDVQARVVMALGETSENEPWLVAGVLPPGSVMPRAVGFSALPIELAGLVERGELGAYDDGTERAYLGHLRLELSFTDCAGVRWRRDNIGRLEEHA